VGFWDKTINPLNAELNPICHLLELLGANHIFHVSGLRVKILQDGTCMYVSKNSFETLRTVPLSPGLFAYSLPYNFVHLVVCCYWL
jgi:hypothetical protein